MPTTARAPKATKILSALSCKSVSGAVSPRPSKSITRLRRLRSGAWTASAGAAPRPKRARSLSRHSAQKPPYTASKRSILAASSHSTRKPKWAGASSRTVCSTKLRKLASLNRPAAPAKTKLRLSEYGSGATAARSSGRPGVGPGSWSCASGRSKMCSTK